MLRRTLIGAAAGVLAAPAVLHAQAGEIVLGLSMVKSGPLKSPGEATETAVDLAVAEINAAGGAAGKRIRLIKFDTGSDPRQAATAVQKFARDDRALAVIGPFSSGEAAVSFPVGERLGIVQISTSSSAPGLTGNNSYAWRMTEDEGKQFGRLLTSLQRKSIPASRAEIIYVSDERVSAITATQFYPPLLRERNIPFGEPISFQYRTFDVAPQVTQLLQRNPQVVALAATPDSAGKVLRELRRQGFRGRVIGSQIFADPNSVELFGPEGEGMLIVAGFWWDRNDATRAFTVKYREENARRGLAQKRIPHHSDAQAYDAVFLCKAAMERAQVTGDVAKLAAERTAIRDALRGIRFTGVTGENTCFDAARDAELPGFIIEIKNQAWSLFDQFPADACT
jgi:branched-chain amino acid transport system substrate-binding protein